MAISARSAAPWLFPNSSNDSLSQASSAAEGLAGGVMKSPSGVCQKEEVVSTCTTQIPRAGVSETK